MGQTNRPRRIILIRHGESQGNIDDAIYETVPDHALTLTALGIEQATEAGRQLRAYLQDEPVTLYASPYVRTRQTVEALGLGVPIEDVRIDARWWNSVRTQPGASTVTVTPVPASSFASASE